MILSSDQNPDEEIRERGREKGATFVQLRRVMERMDLFRNGTEKTRKKKRGLKMSNHGAIKEETVTFSDE